MAWQWNDLGTPPDQTLKTSPIATASNKNNPLAFVWDSAGRLWANRWDGQVGHWEDHGGAPHGQTLNPWPIATASYENNPLAFAFGNNGHLWANWWNGTAWKWQDQGVPPHQTLYPSAIATASYEGNPMAFTWDSAGHLWVNWWNGKVKAWQWQLQGAPQGHTLDPASAIATASYEGNPMAFTWDVDGHLWANWWDGQAWQWKDHGTPPGPDSLYLGEIAAASCQDSPLVFAKTQDRQQIDEHLWANWWDGSAWNWTEQATPPDTHFPLYNIAAVSSQSRPYVFVWDDDSGGDSDPQLWVNWRSQ